MPRGEPGAGASAQSAMQLICDAIVRWIAPVLSFTADEIWQELRAVDPERSNGTVFTRDLVDALVPLGADAALAGERLIARLGS